jgi:hypothetical protein
MAGDVEAVLSSVMVAGGEEEASGVGVVPAGSAVAPDAPGKTVTVVVVTVTPLSIAGSVDNSEAALVVVVVVVVVVVPVVVVVVLVPVVVVAVVVSVVSAAAAVAAAATCEPTRVGNDAVIVLAPPATAGANTPPSAPVAEMTLTACVGLVQVTNCFCCSRTSVSENNMGRVM